MDESSFKSLLFLTEKKKLKLEIMFTKLQRFWVFFFYLVAKDSFCISESTSQDSVKFQFSDARAMAANDGLQGATCGNVNSHLSKVVIKEATGRGGVAQNGVLSKKKKKKQT